MWISRAKGWYNPAALLYSIMIRPRFYSAVIAFVLGMLFLPDLPHTVRTPLAWDIGGVVYLGFALRLMFACKADRIKSHAGAGDDSRIVILLMILFAIAASFVAIAGLIGQAKALDTSQTGKFLLAALAVFTLMTSWGVTQVAFAIHYAHDYYRPDEGDEARGLRFPNCSTPDYWDFLYFAVSIGATSQTSDTEIRSRALRRLVTLHAIVAFFFNTAVLALTVNVAASLAG